MAADETGDGTAGTFEERGKGVAGERGVPVDV